MHAILSNTYRHVANVNVCARAYNIHAVDPFLLANSGQKAIAPTKEIRFMARFRIDTVREAAHFIYSDQQCGFVYTNDRLAGWRIVSDSSWFDKPAPLSTPVQTMGHVSAIMHARYRLPANRYDNPTIESTFLHSQEYHTFRFSVIVK